MNNGFKHGIVVLLIGVGGLLFPIRGYTDDGGMPVTSVEVVRSRAQVRRGPGNTFKLRGFAVKGAQLPVYETADGPGCRRGVWYRVHTHGWICDRHLSPRFDPPFALPQPVMVDERITPWPYAFVKEPSLEYRWSPHGWLEEVREIFKGFGFAVARKVYLDGTVYYETPERRLIPARAAYISGNVSDFAGVHLPKGTPFPIGWINARETWVLDKPNRHKENRVRQMNRYDVFTVMGHVNDGNKRFYQLADGHWVWGRHVQVATHAPRPADVGADEKWIDVDVTNQILTAYQGDDPIFATLVSTGRRGPSRTIKGTFPIWVKVAAIAMDNTQEEKEVDTDNTTDETIIDSGGDTDDPDRRLYSLQDVPWTQFFKDGYALHAVYWHNRFGNRRSHGCVNLSMRDAQWLYNWSEPTVPAGFWSLYTMPDEAATMVRVR